MKRKSLAYNIDLSINRIDELMLYVLMLENIERLLDSFTHKYKGQCEVYCDIGCYIFKEPDYIVKRMVALFHMIVFGSKIKFIEKKIDALLNKELSFSCPSMIKTPLNILCRQCSELTWENPNTC